MKKNMKWALATGLLLSMATTAMGDTCQPESLNTWVVGGTTCTYQGLTFSGFYASHYDPRGEFTPVTFTYNGDKYVGFQASNIEVYLVSPASCFCSRGPVCSVQVWRLNTDAHDALKP